MHGGDRVRAGDPLVDRELPPGPVDTKTFTEHLKRLSADEFEGRKPGTLGERLSTAYIKDQFEQLGLKPGNKGSWFQSVPITEIELVATSPAGQL